MDTTNSDNLFQELLDFQKNHPGWHTEINLATFYLYAPYTCNDVYRGSFEGLIEFIRGIK